MRMRLSVWLAKAQSTRQRLADLCGNTELQGPAPGCPLLQKKGVRMRLRDLYGRRMVCACAQVSTSTCKLASMYAF